MTSSDSKKCEKKIESIEDFYDLRLEGWKETQGKDGFWKMSKAGYFPIRVPQAVVKAHPSEFAEKIAATPDMFQKIYEREEQDTKIDGLEDPKKPDIPLLTASEKLDKILPPPQPGAYIQPTEFILHDTERRMLEAIWVLENLHLLPDQARYEIPFAVQAEDAKGNAIISDGGGDKMRTTAKRFSLADLAVRKLIEIYHKWQKVKDIEKERDELRQEVEVRNIELEEIQYNYDNLTQAMAMKIISTR